MIHRSARLTPIAGKTQRTFVKKALPDSQFINFSLFFLPSKAERSKAQHPHFISYATKLASMLKHTVIVDQV